MARRAEARAAQLLADCGAFSPPVDIEQLVRHQGAMISRSSFKDGDVSGMLLRRDGQPPVIGVNDSQPRLRQRFTIAHELGHLVLHPGREVVLDRPVRINLRDGTSSTATDREEIEANAFAASLLMPADMVREQLMRLPSAIRQDPDRCTTALADLFDVSGPAMGFRLINLGLVS
ncbi:ImmA/IrrE family metallo-endopeptidase [Streptomyces sp. NPDC047049]|uniref:ImmA/IrrE family metallo-endopeptidase n=1 Tax=Streptomyces sp. NPDC047049 TaxID=3156688 RepID=UPI0033E7128D